MSLVAIALVAGGIGASASLFARSSWRCTRAEAVLINVGTTLTVLAILRRVFGV